MLGSQLAINRNYTNYGPQSPFRGVNECNRLIETVNFRIADAASAVYTHAQSKLSSPSLGRSRLVFAKLKILNISKPEICLHRGRLKMLTN